MIKRYSLHPSHKERKRTSWLVKVAGGWSVIQGLYFLFLFPTLIFLHLYQLYQSTLSLREFVELCSMMKIEAERWWLLEFVFKFGNVTISYAQEFYPSLWYMILALPSLIVGVLIWRRWRYARTIALLLEVLVLAFALAWYANEFHPYLYGVMAVSIILVFYLNHYEVKIAFR